MSAIASTVPSMTCTVGKSSRQLGAMAAGTTYRIATTVDAWIAFGDEPAAVAGADGAQYLARPAVGRA